MSIGKGMSGLTARLYDGTKVVYSKLEPLQEGAISQPLKKVVSPGIKADIMSLYYDTKRVAKEHYTKALNFFAATYAVGMIDSAFALGNFPRSIGVGDNIYQTALIAMSIPVAYFAMRDKKAKGLRARAKDLTIKGSNAFTFLVGMDYVSASAQEGMPLTHLPYHHIYWRVPNLEGTWMEGAVNFVNSPSIFFPGFTHGYDWILFPFMANAIWRLWVYTNNNKILREESVIREWDGMEMIEKKNSKLYGALSNLNRY